MFSVVHYAQPINKSHLSNDMPYIVQYHHTIVMQRYKSLCELIMPIFVNGTTYIPMTCTASEQIELITKLMYECFVFISNNSLINHVYINIEFICQFLSLLTHPSYFAEFT